jgi:nucleotide-binding universal stress UspA family protein
MKFKARSLGSYLFMAWDGRRESSRALFDAIPAMLKADSVCLHRINPGYEDKHRIVGITEDLANTLARHGVQLEVSHSTARTRDVGKELLQIAADKGADLIVMGAYGHSRLHELLLGGTTRQVLKEMKIPVLMSH